MVIPEASLHKDQVEDRESVRSPSSETSMKNLKQEHGRSISPEDFRQERGLKQAKASRNRVAVSPSQRSTKMVSKGSAAHQMTKDEPVDEIREEGSDNKASVNMQQSNLVDEEEAKSIPSLNSDYEMISEMNKSKASKLQSKKNVLKSVNKDPSDVSQEEIEGSEPTELDKSSIRIEESEGDVESDESEPDEEDSDDSRAHRNDVSNANLDMLKKELLNDISRIDKKLGFTAGRYFRVIQNSRDQR